MIKTKLYTFILLCLVIALKACESSIQKGVIFQISSINLTDDVIAQGESVNISATFNITGSTNERSPRVLWESDLGNFDSPTQITTIWRAPSDYLGFVKIQLYADFMGHSDVAERVIRIVKTPAAGWGSLSGYVYNEDLTALPNVIVMVGTGEGDTTDSQGFFYLEYLPQGNNGLEFRNIPYAWATELSQQISITGGSHRHLGNILFYTSTPAEISSYQLLPERQAILSIEHKNPDLVNFHELYRANDLSGTTGVKLIRTVESGITEILVQEEVENAFYALKSIPLHGDPSPRSEEWTHIHLINVVDPDAEGSFIVYNNFFRATMNWQSTGYESYYKGFRVVDTSWAWVSPLLGVGTRSYQLSTEPGQTGAYYVLAISNNDLYNDSQPEEQKITLQVPALEPPDNFRGTVRGDYTIRLLWEPLANNNTWYSGYLLEKKTVTDTSTIDWEELTRIATTVTGEFSDLETDSGNIYHYRIGSVVYPPGPGGVYYSTSDSINLSTK